MDAKKQERLDDLKTKVESARGAAENAADGSREHADFKLLEQEEVAAKLRAKHPTPPAVAETKVEAKLDKALKDSVPGSDPVSFSQPALVKPADRKLSTVESSGGHNGKK